MDGELFRFSRPVPHGGGSGDWINVQRRAAAYHRWAMKRRDYLLLNRSGSLKRHGYRDDKNVSPAGGFTVDQGTWEGGGVPVPLQHRILRPCSTEAAGRGAMSVDSLERSRHGVAVRLRKVKRVQVQLEGDIPDHRGSEEVVLYQ